MSEPSFEDPTPVASSAPSLLSGHPQIDESLARLAELDGREVGEHPAEFEHIHRVLRDALVHQHAPSQDRGEGERTGA